MKSFKDTEGRQWDISLTLGEMKRVKAILEVDLLALEQGEPPLLTRLALDVVLLCDVIFVLIKPQADKLSITDEQFGGALGGEAIMDAQTAFYEELVSFFQGLGRKDLVKAVETQHKYIKAIVKRVATKIGDVDLESELSKVGLGTSGSTSTNSQESSD